MTYLSFEVKSIISLAAFNSDKRKTNLNHRQHWQHNMTIRLFTILQGKGLENIHFLKFYVQAFREQFPLPTKIFAFLEPISPQRVLESGFLES